MGGFFGLLAGLVGAAGYVPYVRDILRGRVKPDRASWLIWALQYSGMFLAYIVRGATTSLWLLGLQWISILVIWALSIRYGIGTFSRYERMALACVCLTLLAWAFTKNASVAILMLLAVEATGGVLSAIKAYRHPGSETITMWALMCAAGTLATVALGTNAAPIFYAYPVTLVAINLAVVVSIVAGNRAQRSQPIAEPDPT